MCVSETAKKHIKILWKSRSFLHFLLGKTKKEKGGKKINNLEMEKFEQKFICLKAGNLCPDMKQYCNCK